MKEVENRVIERAREGNLSACEEIYRTYSGFVLRTALSICKNIDDAEEITHEVFIKVLKNLNNFKFNSSFSTYLYRITVNVTLNYIQQRKQIIISNFSDPPDEPPSNTTVEKEVEKKELSALFIRLMEILDNGTRECFFLKEIEDMKYEEIALLLDENVNTIKTRVRRAREKLLNALKEHENEL